MDLDNSMPISAPGNLPFGEKICEIIIDLQVYGDQTVKKANHLTSQEQRLNNKNKLSPVACNNILPKRRHSWSKWEDAAAEVYKRQDSHTQKHIDNDDSTLPSLFTSLNNMLEFTLARQEQRKPLEDVNNNRSEAAHLVKKSNQQIVRKVKSNHF